MTYANGTIIEQPSYQALVKASVEAGYTLEEHTILMDKAESLCNELVGSEDIILVSMTENILEELDVIRSETHVEDELFDHFLYNTLAIEMNALNFAPRMELILLSHVNGRIIAGENASQVLGHIIAHLPRHEERLRGKLPLFSK